MKGRSLPVQVLGLAWTLLVAQAGWQLAWQGLGSGPIFSRFSPVWVVILGAYGLFGGLLGLAGVLALLRPQRVRRLLLDDLWPALGGLRGVRWPLLGVLLVLPTALAFGPTADIFAATSLRAIVLFLAAGLAAMLLPGERQTLGRRLALGVLIGAAVFIFAREFGQVSTYPLKQTWSEGNRLWDYSLYFGRNRYTLAGSFYLPSYMTPGRHGLWSLVYLLPGASIWLVRLWDSILWTLPALALGGALAWRQRRSLPTPLLGGFILWTFVFLAQGPIYAPLLLSAIAIGLGYHRRRPLRTALVTAGACFYAGVSRWTWLVAPAMWAVGWALLDSPREEELWPRLRSPILLAAAGFVGAGLSRPVMDLAVPSTGPFYSTALSQTLLPYRLWPSPTNPLGLLPSLALAIGPLLALGGVALRRRWLRWDWLQGAGIGALLAAFLAVGLVASVKIGGGNNLHNLDMLLVGLVMLAVQALGRLAQAERLAEAGKAGPAQALLALTILVPVWFVLRSGFPLERASRETVAHTLREVQSVVEPAAEQGEVLIVDQRQLVTFGQLDIPLVMDYELKHLFNQAMGSNKAYFENFERDLKHHRFQLIMVFPIKIQYQGRSHQFGEENDAFMKYVAEPLLQYYEPVRQFEETEIWLMAPREVGTTAATDG